MIFLIFVDPTFKIDETNLGVWKLEDVLRYYNSPQLVLQLKAGGMDDVKINDTELNVGFLRSLKKSYFWFRMFKALKVS